MAPETDSNNIAGRVVEGTLISSASSIITIGLGFTRTILLTTFLLPDDVGVFAQALFFVGLSTRIRMPGLAHAFIQRKDSPQNLTTTFFTLQIGSTILSIGIMAALIPIIVMFYPDMPLLSIILFTLLLLEVPKSINDTQTAIFRRDLIFNKVEQANIAGSLCATIVAPLMAWYGLGPWSLVGESAAAQFARTIVLRMHHKRWRLKLGIDRQITRAFWQFGVKIWAGGTFTFAINRFDDFWVGLSLGQAPLGLYSRAYEFAGYSRSVIGAPIVSVFYATFSRLQSDRLRLSKAFFRAVSLIVRVGFLFSLLFVLTAPEFILLLGKQWVPMQTTFQLMVVYIMLEPLWMTFGRLFSAVGHPEISARIRGVQFIIFVPSVIVLSWWQGIVGVAIAADIISIIGILFSLIYIRRFVDYSIRALYFWPLVSFVITAVTILLLTPNFQQMNLWLALFTKLLLITTLYSAIIWLTEREQLQTGWKIIWGLAKPHLSRFRGKLSASLKQNNKN